MLSSSKIKEIIEAWAIAFKPTPTPHLIFFFGNLNNYLYIYKK